VEAVLDETGDGVVKAMRKGEGSPSLTLRIASAFVHVFEKFFN